MASYPFVLIDVFTEKPLSGNPLAVVPGADGLDAETMQAIAREFNFSETTFTLTPRSPGATRRLRSFSPTAEVFGAGHNALGAWWAILERGDVPLPEGETTFWQELGDRVLPVSATWRLGPAPTHRDDSSAAEHRSRTAGPCRARAGALPGSRSARISRVSSLGSSRPVRATSWSRRAASPTSRGFVSTHASSRPWPSLSAVKDAISTVSRRGSLRPWRTREGSFPALASTRTRRREAPPARSRTTSWRGGARPRVSGSKSSKATRSSGRVESRYGCKAIEWKWPDDARSWEKALSASNEW